MSEAVVISHSEVESYLSCQQKHYYAFMDSTFGPFAGLEPVTFSDSLFRGIQGHEALGVFFTAIKDGDDIPTAAEKSYIYLRTVGVRPEILNNPSHLKIVMDLANRILPRFYANEVVTLLAQGWKPVYVEHTFRLRMEFVNGTFVYPFKPDVVMSDSSGNLWIWDHKFVYNFYGDAEIKLLPQLPKYIGALRANDIYIKGGYYNQLRWREVKDLDNHVRHDKVVPTDKRVENAFRQQYRVTTEIADKKLRISKGEPVEPPTRVLSTMVCKSCSFKHLCAADLNGENTTLMKKVEFRANTYGYTETGE